MDRVAGFEARFAYALTPRALDRSRWHDARPDVSVTIGQDVESSGTTLVAETVSQYTVDVGGLFKLPWPRQSPRGTALCDRGRRLSPPAARGPVARRDRTHDLRRRRRAIRASHARRTRWASAPRPGWCGGSAASTSTEPHDSGVQSLRLLHILTHEVHEARRHEGHDETQSTVHQDSA